MHPRVAFEVHLDFSSEIPTGVLPILQNVYVVLFSEISLEIHPGGPSAVSPEFLMGFLQTFFCDFIKSFSGILQTISSGILPANSFGIHLKISPRVLRRISAEVLFGI